MEKNAVTELLAVQYEGAVVEMTDEVLPKLERVFYKEGLEKLITLPEGSKLVLKKVRLDKNYKPVTMDWAVQSENPQIEIDYSYLIEGNHNQGGASEMTVLMRTETEGGMPFAEIVAQYNNEKAAWEYQ